MAMKYHGVDIATAVDVQAAIYQRSLGADLYIVGGWRSRTMTSVQVAGRHFPARI